MAESVAGVPLLAFTALKNGGGADGMGGGGGGGEALAPSAYVSPTFERRLSTMQLLATVGASSENVTGRGARRRTPTHHATCAIPHPPCAMPAPHAMCRSSTLRSPCSSSPTGQTRRGSRMRAHPRHPLGTAPRRQPPLGGTARSFAGQRRWRRALSLPRRARASAPSSAGGASRCSPCGCSSTCRCNGCRARCLAPPAPPPTPRSSPSPPPTARRSRRRRRWPPTAACSRPPPTPSGYLVAPPTSFSRHSRRSSRGSFP